MGWIHSFRPPAAPIQSPMRKKRQMIRIGIGMLSLCAAAWSIPPMLEKVENARSGGLNGLVGLGAVPGLPEGAGESKAASEVLMITPGGEEITPEERARLLAQAKATAPLPLEAQDSSRASDKPSIKGANIDAILDAPTTSLLDDHPQ